MKLALIFTPINNSQVPITHINAEINHAQWAAIRQIVLLDFPREEGIGRIEINVSESDYSCSPSRSSITIEQWNALKGAIGTNGRMMVIGAGGAAGGPISEIGNTTIHGTGGNGGVGMYLTGKLVTPSHTATLQEIRDILTDPKFNSMRCQDAVRLIDKALKS